MTFTNLWPLVFLILIPIIILLYMLKQKANDYDFSSIILWKQVYKNIEATKPWEKLKKNLLMYLQIAAVLLLIFALMAPYLKSGGRAYNNVIIVLDNSGSMNYAYNDKKTRLEEEIERACDYVDSLSETSMVTVISCGTEAKIEISNSTDKGEVKRRIRAIEATDLAGDLNASVGLVGSIASEWDTYGAVFYTDTAVDLGQLENASVVNLYTEGVNVSLDYVSHGTDEQGMVVLAKVTNHSDEGISQDVNLYGDDTLLDIQTVNLSAGESQVIYFYGISFNGNVLKAQLNDKDALENDNTAYSVVNASQAKRILLITQSNLFLEKAISAVSTAELYKATDVSAVSDENAFDLYIFDGVMPETLPASGNLLFLNSPSGSLGGEVTVTGTESNIYLTILPSEVTEYVDNFSFGVNQAVLMEKPVWATSFINVNGSSAAYFGETNGRRIAAMGFDIHATDFALQAEFPILISNLMEYMLENGLMDNTKYVAGDKVDFNANINGSDLTVINSQNEVITIKPDAVVSSFVDTEQAGIYQVSQTYEGEVKTQYFSVGFPVDTESKVEQAEEVESGQEVSDTKLSGGRELRNVIILLLLILLMVEWIVYIRQH